MYVHTISLGVAQGHPRQALLSACSPPAHHCPGPDSPVSPAKELTHAVRKQQRALEERLEACLEELRRLCLREAVRAGHPRRAGSARVRAPARLHTHTRARARASSSLIRGAQSPVLFGMVRLRGGNPNPERVWGLRRGWWCLVLNVDTGQLREGTVCSGHGGAQAQGRREERLQGDRVDGGLWGLSPGQSRSPDKGSRRRLEDQ